MPEYSEALHVLFSMDCLPPRAPADIAGPESWTQARRNILRFADAVADAGMRATFFIVPESLSDLQEVAEKLQDRGMELGVLGHPQISGYKASLGSYDYERQREIVRIMRTNWENRLGSSPTCFRPGFFSGNDYTFQILCVEGFHEASCSLPGMVDEERYSMWSGSYPYAHHTDPLDRMVRGNMELYEVPVTSDHEATGDGQSNLFTPQHLRLEDPEIGSFAFDLIEEQLDEMEEEAVPIRTINFVTRNTVNWGANDDPHVERVQNLVKMLRDLSDRRNLELKSATLQSAHETADEKWHAARE